MEQMNEDLKPYCTIVGGTYVAFVVYGNELSDLNGHERDASDPFWYVMGTDAWFEKQESNEQNYLVAKTYDKDYFTVPVDNDTLKLLKTEKGVLVLFPNFPLEAEDIKQTSDLKELRGWVDNKIVDENLDGVIYCFYTEEDKKKYHEGQKNT